MIITGIGARSTPDEFLGLLTELGKEARERDWWVRSGHAEGADYAFEKGAQDRCIVYLPWRGFNKDLPLLGISRYSDLREDVPDVVYRHDPYAGDHLSQGVKLIKSRNVYQVLGEDLKSPSDLVVCWTSCGGHVGGTALALRIARANNIPVVNLGKPETSSDLNNIMRKITGEIEV